MDKLIRVLFVHHGSGIGGAPISLLNVAKNLNQDRFKVKVVLLREGVAEELFRESGVSTELVVCQGGFFSHTETRKVSWWQFYRYIKVYRDWQYTLNRLAPEYLASQRFDILHLNSHVLTSWAAAGRRLNKKVVLHNREAIAKGYFGVRRNILRRLIKQNCDAVINISEDNRHRLGLNENSLVIYNSVPIPPKFRLSMSNPIGPKKVLYLGGQASIKGFETAVDCLPFLDPGIVIEFAGNYGTIERGATRRDILKRYVKLSVFRKSYGRLEKIKKASNARLLGLLKDPLSAIDSCDILITPFHAPHFSRPVIEAFAYGKPVIGSDVEGMEEIIEHGVDGLLVAKKDPRALAAAINNLCAHSPVARNMGLKGREKAERLFSVEQNITKVEAVYERLMAEAR